MQKNSLLVMALLSGLALSANAQEKDGAGKPSPIAVAKAAFGVSVPSVTPIATVANTSITTTTTKAPVVNVAPPNALPAAAAANTPTVSQSIPEALSPEALSPEANPVEENSDIKINDDEVSEIDEKTRADNEIIRGVLSSFADAVTDKNFNKFVSVTRDHLIVVGSDQEFLTGKKSIEEYFPKTIGGKFKFQRVGISFDPGSTIEISSSGDLAKVYGRGTEKYRFNDIEHTLPIRWTSNVVKDGEEWKIASFHSGVNFSNNAIIDSLEEFGWKAGIVAGLVGTLVGFILGVAVMAAVRRK